MDTKATMVNKDTSYTIRARGNGIYVVKSYDGKPVSQALLTKSFPNKLKSGDRVKINTKGMNRIQLASVLQLLNASGRFLKK